MLDEESLAKVRSTVMDSDPRVRWEAAKFLLSVKDPQAESILFRMLRSDDDAAIRRDSVTALAGLGGPSAAARIIPALKDSDANVRMTALASLGRIGDPSAAPAISESLRDPDDRVRLTALKTLNDLEKKRAQEVRKIEDARKRYLEEQERRRLLQQQQKKR